MTNPMSSLTVTGTGHLSITPDVIDITIYMSEVQKAYDAAFEASSRHVAGLRKAVEAAGLDPKDLKTTNFGINAKYERRNDQQEFVGYEYHHNLTIRFDNDNTQLGKVLYELSQSDTQSEFQIQYSVKDTETYKEQLMTLAVEDGKRKAKVLAAASDVKLVEILRIEYGAAALDFGVRPMNRMMGASVMKTANRAMSMDIEAEDIKLEDSVTMVWRIEEASV